jgi:hypothetical protein
MYADLFTPFILKAIDNVENAWCGKEMCLTGERYMRVFIEVHAVPYLESTSPTDGNVIDFRISTAMMQLIEGASIGLIKDMHAIRQGLAEAPDGLKKWLDTMERLGGKASDFSVS